jgi:hypothetical protein
MPFQPDIVVTTPGGPGVTLVVEAKPTLPDLERTEDGLKIYMTLMQCPTGLLITRDRMWLYQDSYTSRSPQSIRRVGEFNLKPLWDQPPPEQEARFETFVQRWLEDLAKQPAEELPKELRAALREYVLPALMGGDVRAAHPR